MQKFKILTVILAFSSCVQVPKDTVSKTEDAIHWDNLIDTDLTDWDVYLSYQIQPGYDGSVPKNEKGGEEMAPIGLNNPDYTVFSTLVENGDTIIRNTGGEYYGALITKKEYANYHFQLKYKWGGDLKWAYRKNLLKDSGILYHSIGPMAAEYWRSWMLSQEFQIMEAIPGGIFGAKQTPLLIYAPTNRNQLWIPWLMNLKTS